MIESSSERRVVGPRPRIALVTPGLSHSGGVSSVTDFLYTAISSDERFDVDLLSVATSSRDAASVRLLRPETWMDGPTTYTSDWCDRGYTHVGTRWAEFEFARYLPNPVLTALLNEYDLVQFVSGSPAWANLAKEVESPVALQVATLAKVERASRQARGGGLAEVWRRGMTAITARLDMVALRHVDVAFVENQWMLDLLRERMGADRVVFAPPGVDTRVFRPKEPDEQVAEPFLLSVGRFADARKNVPLLFRAYARLCGRLECTPKLVLAGKTGPTPSDWQLAGRLGIRDYVDYRANVSPDELTKLYRMCEAFVLSSDEEGFGMVIVEAMASGAAVISTACGGPEDIIHAGRDGLLVPRDDVHALAGEMERVLRDRSLRDRLRAGAAQTASSRFSLEATGHIYLSRYEDMLKQVRSR